MRPPEKLASFVRPAKAGVFSRVQPAGAKVRRPVAWMAGWRETETLKPIDKVSLGEIASHRAVMRVNAKWPRKQMNPGAEPANEGRRQNGVQKSDRRGILISAG